MIRTIDLHNFKCFKDVSFSSKPLTVLAGANGAGKSSLLQALLMMRQSYSPEEHVPGSRITLRGNLIDLISSDKVKNKFTEDNSVAIVIDDTDMDDDFTLEIANAGTPATEPEGLYSDNKDEAVAKMSLYADDFLYLYANRLSPAPEYKRSGRTLYTDSRLGDRSGSETVFCLQRIFDENTPLAVGTLDLSGNGDVASNVNRWISYIIGSELKVKPDSETKDNAKLIFTPLDGEATDSTNMAFGDTYILPIVLGILTAGPGSLVIIENPEAHLHPRAQRRMGEFLAAAAHADVQIFIETHSDHLLNGIRLSVKKDKLSSDKVIVHFIEDVDGEHLRSEISVEPDGSLSGWPQGFFNEWENALCELAD